jgi:pimeloyl-ACP methyl ester carboxylesterase
MTPTSARSTTTAAQNIGSDRNPVIVIPGILGSKLERSRDDGDPVWGSFTYGAADADTAEGARLVALPMQMGAPLSEIRDDVVPTEVLDTLTLDVGLLRGVELGAYVDILKTLAAGKYRDETLGESGAIDYGGLHYTCFQFAYDWRRDLSEHGGGLHEMVLDALAAQPHGGGKVDIVAHSMGGLVLRYYLRYGPDPLPEDGSLPELDWEGARYVEKAILIGTPSGGLGADAGAAGGGRELRVADHADVPPGGAGDDAGDLPAAAAHAARAGGGRATGERDRRVRSAASGSGRGWGLADPDQDGVLRQLLPGRGLGRAAGDRAGPPGEVRWRRPSSCTGRWTSPRRLPRGLSMA